MNGCTPHCGYCGRCSGDSGGSIACTDCGGPVLNGPDETGALCEECCADRDDWAVGYQIRMAKAAIQKVHTPVVVEVALVPIGPAQAGVVDVALVPIGNVDGPVMDVALVPLVAAFVLWAGRKEDVA